MKVLIVSPARSGGTSLLNWVSSELELNPISEPLNDWRGKNRIENFWKLKNVCVKIFPYDCPLSVQEYFDKTIILTRLNLIDQSISMTNAKKTSNWHGNYKIDKKWLNDNNTSIKENLTLLRSWNDGCLEWARKTNISVTYEGIFYRINNDLEKVKNYLNIRKPKNEWILDPKNKYRIFTDEFKPKIL